MCNQRCPLAFTPACFSPSALSHSAKLGGSLVSSSLGSSLSKVFSGDMKGSWLGQRQKLSQPPPEVHRSREERLEPALRAAQEVSLQLVSCHPCRLHTSWALSLATDRTASARVCFTSPEAHSFTHTRCHPTCREHGLGAPPPVRRLSRRGPRSLALRPLIFPSLPKTFPSLWLLKGFVP